MGRVSEPIPSLLDYISFTNLAPDLIIRELYEGYDNNRGDEGEQSMVHSGPRGTSTL